MNHTLQSMLAKCINDEQSNWSQQLPYVMMAYRTSVHESTGYTPHFLVNGQEVCLPIDFMYPNPSGQPSADTMNLCLPDKSDFKRRTIRLVRLSISISDAETPFTIERSTDPPIKSIKRFCYITPSSQLESHQSSLASENVHMSFYNALMM